MAGIVFSSWAVLILLGAAQGLFLSVSLFAKTENRGANKWLAFLLAAISLHLIEYGADIAGITLKYPFLLASTYPLLFCLGPFYLLYCRSLLDKSYRFGFRQLLHFLPALIVLLMMMPFYAMTGDRKVGFIQELHASGDLRIPTEQLLFMAMHIAQSVAYAYAAHKFIAGREREFKAVSSDVVVVRKLKWLNIFSLCFSAYLVLYLLLVVTLSFTDSYQLQADYALLLITSFALYTIGYSAVQSPEILKAFPDPESETLKTDAQAPSAEPKNGNKFPELKRALLQFMETARPYLKSDLKISELADSLSVPYYQLSQLINDEFLVNFYDFVNKYRVEDAKKLLVEDDRNYTILAIAYESGFNSKATFNRVFKKFTDLTPSEFKVQFSPSPDNGEASKA